MEDKIKKLKQCAIAYTASLEFDRCPDPSKSKKVKELFDYDLTEIKSALTEYQGNRPDEIAGVMTGMIDNI